MGFRSAILIPFKILPKSSQPVLVWKVFKIITFYVTRNFTQRKLLIECGQNVPLSL